MIKDISIGDKVLGKRGNRKVSGIVVLIHPGCVVIENSKNSEERIVIDADRIFKVIKNK